MSKNNKMTNSTEYLKKEAEYQDAKVEKKVRKNMDNFYTDEASVYRFNHRLALIGDLDGKKVLDLGCGKGYMTLSFLEMGAYVTAIDISPKSVELVKKNAADIGKNDNLTAIVMDAHSLELDNEIFDIVIADGILHHLTNLSQALNEIKRVLKPDGYAIITEPLGMNWFLRFYRFITPKLRSSDEHPFKMKEINMLKEIFPNSKFYFFELTTLLSKPFIALKMKRFANGLQKTLLKCDKKLIMKETEKITFLQRMSWMFIVKAASDASNSARFSSTNNSHEMK